MRLEKRGSVWQWSHKILQLFDGDNMETAALEFSVLTSVHLELMAMQLQTVIECLIWKETTNSILLTLTPHLIKLESCCEKDLMLLLSIFNIHILFPPQGADKSPKTPDGKSAFEAAERDDIKALLKWDATVWEVAGQVGERTDRWMQWSPDRRWPRPVYPDQPLS